MLLKNIKQDLKESRDMPCFWLKVSIDKNFNSPKLIYKCHAI